ncbi:MAG: 6-phosphofructokinase [Phycisphaerales bacterium]
MPAPLFGDLAMAGRVQRIGILTGGGDCPGLNAVIRAVTKAALYRHGVRVFGIEDGFQGLVENRVRELLALNVSGIMNRGGTILGTNNRLNPSRMFVGNDADGNPIFESRIDRCLEVIEAAELDALVVIGGDGTMSCAAPFVEAGINCIGVPKTIDNDIHGTDITFGFTTAYTTATLSLDRLHTTAESHHRVIVCETMGRNAGWLALHAGIASGSDVILLPEIPYDIQAVCDFCMSRTDRGRGFSIVCCAEGARPIDGDVSVKRVDPTSPDPIRLGGISRIVAGEIEERTGLETRTTVLGHVQRGGPPVAADRVLATQFGYAAIERLMAGARARMIVMQNGEITDMDLREVANRQRLVPPDHRLVTMARSVRTCFGDA